MIKVLNGRWQDVLPEWPFSAVITDPPYTKRTILGFRSGSNYRNNLEEKTRYNISYDSIDEKEITDLCFWIDKHVTFWAIIFNDHIGTKLFSDELTRLNWHVFAPVGWVKSNPPPRLLGDGPACGTEWISVARRKKRLPSDRMRSRSGGYHGPAYADHNRRIVTGQKPEWLMEQIIREYTLPGDLIVDPYCGGGTTARVCKTLNRCCVTTEIDPETYSRAKKRINANHTYNFLEALEA